MDGDVGRFVLGNTFPRTGRVAGAELLVLSALRRHRQVLDRPNALHLFSEQLQVARWTQAWLAEQKTAGAVPLVGELEAWTDSGMAASALRSWLSAHEPPAGEHVVEAVSLGRVHAGELAEPGRLAGIVRDLASCYVDMMEFRPPYFNLAAG